MARIERLVAHRLRVPLTRPYKLAFGAVTHYDTIVIDVLLSDGRAGFGEATLLTGYTDETIDGSWSLVRELLPTLGGATSEKGATAMRALAGRAPFVASAFACALEHAQGHALLAAAGRVPVLGLLQGDDEAELADECARLLEAGYRTFKLKVGFDADADARHVALAQRVVEGRAALRVDANQGFDAAAAQRFIAAVDPRGIELFEQPCAAGDWDAHAVAVRAAARTGLPLMLDESIYGVADIDRAAAAHACTYLKVKLMKFAGIGALVEAIQRIRARGMRPVLGNGVAADPSCWMEACVAARHIDNAGEMNGFLKVPQRLLAAPLAFDNGSIVLTGAPQSLDRDALAAARVDQLAHPASITACAPTPSSPA